MISRASIIRCARTYVGTPFHPCGRRKGVALDCGGLIAGVYTELVGPHKAPAVYSMYPDGKTLQAIMDLNCEPICQKCCGPGDIVGFWSDRQNVLQHLGILTNIGIIHARAKSKKCVETGVSKMMADRLMRAWKFPGAEPREDFEPEDLHDITDPLRYYERRCCRGDAGVNGGR